MRQKLIDKFGDRAFDVGGSVRDLLLDLEPLDIDYVVEATEEEFLAKFPEAVKHGGDFPTYKLQDDDLAITRRETKKLNGTSYQDYDCETGTDAPISLLEDLKRRDFATNAIARRLTTGEIIDPHNGRDDLHHRVLRCVNPTTFADDATRFYRACRFAARFDFVFDPETAALMKANAANLINVKPDRVYKELKKMYEDSPAPSVFFRALAHVGGLHVHFKPIEDLIAVPAGPSEYHGHASAFDHTMHVIDACKAADLPFHAFIGCLVHDIGKAKTPSASWPAHHSHEKLGEGILPEWLKEHRFPSPTPKFAQIFTAYHMHGQRAAELRPGSLIQLYRKVSKPYWDLFVKACNCDHELSDKARLCLEMVPISIAETKIEIPESLRTRDKETVESFVLGKIISTFKSKVRNG